MLFSLILLHLRKICRILPGVSIFEWKLSPLGCIASLGIPRGKTALVPFFVQSLIFGIAARCKRSPSPCKCKSFDESFTLFNYLTTICSVSALRAMAMASCCVSLMFASRQQRYSPTIPSTAHAVHSRQTISDIAISQWHRHPLTPFSYSYDRTNLSSSLYDATNQFVSGVDDANDDSLSPRSEARIDRLPTLTQKRDFLAKRKERDARRRELMVVTVDGDDVWLCETWRGGWFGLI